MTARARVEHSAFTGSASLNIIVESGDAPDLDERERRRWAALQAENPALFDGPIYTVTDLDADAGAITCRRGRYREIVLRRPGDDVRLLSVTGLLVCGERILLGQRGAQLRSYPGMWEIGPAGGVEPGEEREDVSIDVIRRALSAEIIEEIGVSVDTRAARFIGVCIDDAAQSLDVVLRIDLDGPEAPELRHGAGWEYQDAAWVEVSRLRGFTCEHATIAPSRAIMQAMGWL